MNPSESLTTDLVIRRARPEDARDLASVFVAAWRHGYPEILAPEVIARFTAGGVTEWMAGLVSEAATGGPVTEVGTDATGVVGFIRYGQDPDGSGGAYISALYVHPASAGRGVGGQLIRRARQEVTSGGYRSVALHVFRDNSRARGLYERHGFRSDGREWTEPEYGVPQIRMTVPLAGPEHDR